MPVQPEQPESEQSFAAGLGCMLIFMGLVTMVFGLAALLGVSDRIELDFFGIALNTPTGRAVWVAGSILAVTAGVVLLWTRRGE